MRSHSGWITLLYNLIHAIRRIAFVLVAIYLHRQPWIQTILFIVASEIVCVYLLSVLPYESKNQNRLEIINEIMVLITGYCMLISVGWNMPPSARLYVGLTTIFFIVAVVLLNIARWLVFLIKYARMNYKRYFGRMINVQG